MRGRLQIVAMRNIAAGEEITFDYAMSETSEYSMLCRCGQSNCRKTVTGNDWCLPDLQQRYGQFFSQYIRNKIDGVPYLACAQQKFLTC
jgi:hypothetical protein